MAHGHRCLQLTDGPADGKTCMTSTLSPVTTPLPTGLGSLTVENVDVKLSLTVEVGNGGVPRLVLNSVVVVVGNAELVTSATMASAFYNFVAMVFRAQLR
jgi:hypothetical protein